MGRAQILLADDTIEFDLNPDLLGINNHVFDFNEECFRRARFDDYVSWSVGFEFRPVMKGMRIVKDGIIELVQEEMTEEDKSQNGRYKTDFEKDSTV